MPDKSYKLIGVINLSEINPAIFQPVFEKEGKYYFHYTYDGKRITDFYEMATGLNSKFIKLEDCKIKTLEETDEYSVGDKNIIVIKLDKNEFFVVKFETFSNLTEKCNSIEEWLSAVREFFEEMEETKGNAKVKKYN